MGATANFDSTSSTPIQSDDMAFGRAGGSNPSSMPMSGTGPVDMPSSGEKGQSNMDSAKGAISSGVGKAQDIVGQLQSKASDMATKLVNNVDVDDLTQKLEQQVRDHPARTLLMAAGAGYLLGKSMK